MDISTIEAIIRPLRPYVDASGLHVPDYEAVKGALVTAWRGIYGDDIYVDPDSQDGQLIAVFALALLDSYQAMEAVYHSYSPHTAIGEGLSRMVKINGLKRRPGAHSQADVRIVAVPGTTIQNGVARTASGTRWLLPAVVAVPSAGEIVATATAEDMGAIPALPGEISEIATPTRGWQSVSNPNAAVLGAPVETDSQLRARQSFSTALPSRTVFEGTLGAVAAIKDVLRVRGYENDTSIPDAFGLPPHSICVVVEGGDAATIAAAIAAKKTPGCGTWGGVSTLVTDTKGMVTTIRFSRPQVVSVAVRVTVRALQGYLASTGEAMRDAVAAYITGLRIGDDLLVSRLSCPVNDADPTPRTPTFDIVSLEAGILGEAFGFANISVGYDGAAYCDRENVEVVVTL